MKTIYALLLLISLPRIALSQDYSAMPKDSIVVKALRDELYRNLSMLESKDAGKPFFISYTYSDGQVTEASALLGALLSSGNYPVSDWNLRLMMGNYNINDENFEDRYSQESETQEIRIKPPIEPDYWNIRKMFWWNTGNIFRSASQNYKNKLAALKDKPIQSEDEKMPDYQQSNPIKLFQTNTSTVISKIKAENYVRDLSSVFKSLKNVHSSNVSLYTISANVYVVNTEGTELKIPINLSYIHVSSSIYDDKGNELSESLTFFSKHFNELPPIDTIKNASRTLTKYLSDLKKSDKITEDYTGPVLVYNDAAANILASGLFSGSTALKAYRKPLVNDLSKEMAPIENNSIESKIDRKVISKDLSIKALPHLDSFNGINLEGSFEVDAEGIVPPDEIDLVEKGILKTLLSGRVPSKKCPVSNGHNRIAISGNNFYSAISPGVIKINSANMHSDEELRNQIIEIALDNGLDHVYIIKPIFSMNNCNGPLGYYQFDINTKKEKLVRPLSINGINLYTLNKISGSGNKTFVKNMLFENNGFSDTYTTSGVYASFIVPNALLIKEIELQAPEEYGNTDVPIFPNAVSELEN
jgi:hypothetical protein